MANKPMQAWSYSTLTSYETCPRRHYLTKVARTVTEPQTEAIVWGNTVHKALETRANTGAELPVVIKPYEQLVDSIRSAPGELVVERKFAIDKQFKPTEWKTSWARGIVDIGVINGNKASLFDWKTGKVKPDSDQMKLMALLTMATYDQITVVDTAFVYLKHNHIDKENFTRDQVPDLWNEFLPRVTRMEKAYEQDKWEPKPSGLCRSWCPCTGCEFNGVYRGPK